MNTRKILMIEDNPGDARLFQEAIRGISEFDLAWAKTLSEGFAVLEKEKIDVVVLDLSLPDSHGLDTVVRVRQRAPLLPIVVLTGLDDYTVGLETVRAGAQDYLVKGMFDADLLSRAVSYSIERKANEEALRESEERLRQKNKEILDYVDMVTHDLKKPLSAIKTVLSMFGRGPFGEINESGREALAVGKEAVRYMQELLEDLLDCAKIETGACRLEKEKLNPAEIMEQVLTRLKVQIAEKGIQVSVQGNTDIHADRKVLQKIFMNLIGNAVAYIGQGKDGRITVGCRAEKDGHLLYVQDTGIGIPEQDQAGIFDKFKRGRNVEGISGTGLGLAIVKAGVEAHGGRIWVESEQGKGTTFWFKIPGQSDG